MRRSAIAALCMGLGCQGEGSCVADLGAAQPQAQVEANAPTPEPWYALDPFVQSLRPELRGAPVVDGADRLPLYELDMDVTGRDFVLRETLWFTNDSAAPVADLGLRIYANAVGDASPTDSAATRADAPVKLLSAQCLGAVRCQVETVSSSALRVVPETPLAAGARLRVQLELGGELVSIDPTRLDLFAQGMESLANLGAHTGDGDYGLLAEGDGVRSFANFYAVLARRTATGWQLEDDSTLGDLGSDELSHVRLRVLLPEGTRAVASGVAGPAPSVVAEGKYAHEFVAGFVRDFSVLVSDQFRTREARVGAVQVRSHFLASDADKGARVLEVARGALTLYERSFGPYPYTEFDVVEAPLIGGAGGVEFSGLVTVASMFYRKPGKRAATAMPELGAQQELFDAMLEFVTAHEVAHQYWHGLVGSDSRAAPFLDEGLAQFSALLYMEATYGKARAELEQQRQVVMSYRLMRALGIQDAPVLQPVARFEGMVQYAGLVYGKGPLVYTALRERLGERTLFAALRQYVRDWAFRVAPRDALFDALVRAGGRAQVEPVWKRWVEERHGDEDLATEGAGLASLLGGALGGTPGGALSGQDAQALQPLLQQLLGQGGESLPQELDLGVLEQLLGLTAQQRGGGPHTR